MSFVAQYDSLIKVVDEGMKALIFSVLPMGADSGINSVKMSNYNPLVLLQYLEGS